VLAGVDGVLLGGQPEGVEAEGVQYVMPGHAQVPPEHVGADVAQRVTDVQPDAAGIGEEVDQVELGPPGHAAEPGRQGAVRERVRALGAGRVRGVEGALALPPVLPAQLDLVRQPRVVPEARRPLVHRALLVHRRPETKKPLTHEGLPH
jgi:hypothetical protein